MTWIEIAMVLVVPLSTLFSALAAYFAARAKALSASNAEQLVGIGAKATTAAGAAVVAKQTAAKVAEVNAAERVDNAVKMDEIHQLVNGRHAALQAELTAAREEIVTLKATVALIAKAADAPPKETL